MVALGLDYEIRQKIREIALRHGASNVRVFGSFARGEQTVASDLDLLVTAGAETPPWFPGGMLADLEDLLGRPVDVVTEAGLHPLLRDRILGEAVPL